MATITKDLADAESRVRARAQFQKDLVEESNRLLRENPTVPFRLGEENGDAVKTEISKRTGIPFSPEAKQPEAKETATKQPEAKETAIKHADNTTPSNRPTASNTDSSYKEDSRPARGGVPATAPSLRPATQTILTEFEVIPDNEKVTVNEGALKPRKMHAGPRMFNFGFSFTPAHSVSKTQKEK